MYTCTYINTTVCIEGILPSGTNPESQVWGIRCSFYLLRAICVSYIHILCVSYIHILCIYICIYIYMYIYTYLDIVKFMRNLHVNINSYLSFTYTQELGLKACTDASTGWLRLVGSLKLYVSLESVGLFCRALLQQRPIISRSLLVVATPYFTLASVHYFYTDCCMHINTYIYMCVNICVYVHIYVYGEFDVLLCYMYSIYTYTCIYVYM